MLRTSESVGAGHPDKICDQVADAILNAHLTLDPAARVACVVAAPAAELVVFGEITSSARPDLEAIARSALRAAGYTGGESGLGPTAYPVRIELAAQSAEIAGGVGHADSADRYDAIGAGDQGTVSGYATDETPEGIPAPLAISHRLMRALHELRSAGYQPIHHAIGPDAKAQASVRYEHGRPSQHSIVLSARLTAGLFPQ
jgi:S-adenosylmethionine synthetase